MTVINHRDAPIVNAVAALRDALELCVSLAEVSLLGKPMTKDMLCFDRYSELKCHDTVQEFFRLAREGQPPTLKDMDALKDLKNSVSAKLENELYRSDVTWDCAEDQETPIVREIHRLVETNNRINHVADIVRAATVPLRILPDESRLLNKSSDAAALLING